MTRILIADDHDVVRSGLRSILEEQAGWEIVGEAVDGLEVKQALATRPDVAVLDYALPLVNGVEATRQIRSRAPGVEILIFTMHDTDALVREALEAGARGFLLKIGCEAISYLCRRDARRPSALLHRKGLGGLLDSYLAKGVATEPLISAREKSVVQLIAEGLTNKQIAEVLSVSLKTVEAHRAAAMRKLNVTTTAGLIRYAVRNKLVEA